MATTLTLPPAFYEVAVGSQALPLVVVTVLSHDAECKAVGRSRAAFYSRFLMIDVRSPSHHVIRIGGAALISRTILCGIGLADALAPPSRGFASRRPRR
jgi:hypothetical protein